MGLVISMRKAVYSHQSHHGVIEFVGSFGKVSRSVRLVR